MDTETKTEIKPRYMFYFENTKYFFFSDKHKIKLEIILNMFKVIRYKAKCH